TCCCGRSMAVAVIVRTSAGSRLLASAAAPDSEPMPFPSPVAPAATMVPPGPTPPGVPARGGLTAAQVRGTTGPVPGLAPAPATGWPQAQSWPNAAGMGQTG
ncbi:histidinol-phosphate aminotransferase family protein, partial [Streptomyces sp. NPDC007110]